MAIRQADVLTREMIYMHCRIRVVDFSKWKSEMEADAEAQLNAGLGLIRLWRGLEEQVL